MKTNPIISAEELKQIDGSENLVIIDARSGKNARENYLAKHIKNARFLDLDKDLAETGADASVGGRHPLPTVENFAKTLSDKGISKDSNVVVYDNTSGANAAARAWWMMKAFGIENVRVLDGGLQSAEKQGVGMGSGEERYETAEPIKISGWQLPTIKIDEVENGLQNGNLTVIDVRDAYRYRGESEPIDLVAGHIPGAQNIPFSENLDAEGKFLQPSKLKEKYTEFLKGKSQDVAIHCGSGVTACHTILALVYAGLKMPKLYVGSWSEWSRTGREIATETQ